jgi:cell division protein ZapA
MPPPQCYLPSMGEPVELQVGGKTYRVVASAEADSLQRLAGIVDERLRDIAGPGNALAPQSLLLVAISLAHDLEEERQRRAHVEARSRETLRNVLARIDEALETADGLEGHPGAESATEHSQPTADS